MKITAEEGDVIEIDVNGVTIELRVGMKVKLGIPGEFNPRKRAVVSSIEEPDDDDPILPAEQPAPAPDATHTTYQPPGRPLMALAAGGPVALPPIGSKFTRCNSVMCGANERPVFDLAAVKCAVCKTKFEYDYVVTPPTGAPS